MNNWTPPSVTAVVDPSNTEDVQLFSFLEIPITGESHKGSWALQRTLGALSLTGVDGLTQSVDFTAGKMRHRSREAGHGAAPLKKALGISAFEKRQERKPRIVDATGGWGQDAWLMASMGCNVELIEQHKVVYALLWDAVRRARQTKGCADVAHRVELHYGDAKSKLSQLAADVVYLDPMYPHRARKKADSKKGMQMLQALLGPADENQSEALLDAALSTNTTRIVVKRPKGSTVLEPPPTFDGQLIEIQSPNTRYDIYISHSA